MTELRSGEPVQRFARVELAELCEHRYNGACRVTSEALELVISGVPTELYQACLHDIKLQSIGTCIIQIPNSSININACAPPLP